MAYHVYYYRPHRIWYGYWMDNNGDEISNAVTAPSRDQIFIELGKQFEECLSILRGMVE